jgi:hypothetical protein
MRRGTGPTVVALVAAASAALLAAGATASPQATLVIQPAQAIGKLRLGMTEAEARRAMSRPRAIVRQRSGFGLSAVEYQYGFAEYTVRFVGPRGRRRAVRVTTVLRRERTTRGIGPGSRERDVIRAYPRVRCEPLRTFRIGDVVYAAAPRGWGGRLCTLFAASGRRTVFTSQRPYSAIVARPVPVGTWLRTARITEVAVAASS